MLPRRTSHATPRTVLPLHPNMDCPPPPPPQPLPSPRRPHWCYGPPLPYVRRTKPRRWLRQLCVMCRWGQDIGLHHHLCPPECLHPWSAAAVSRVVRPKTQAGRSFPTHASSLAPLRTLSPPQRPLRPPVRPLQLQRPPHAGQPVAHRPLLDQEPRHVHEPLAPPNTSLPRLGSACGPSRASPTRWSSSRPVYSPPRASPPRWTSPHAPYHPSSASYTR